MPSRPTSAQTAPPRSPPTLDEQLCFSLYGAALEVGRTYKPLLDELGLTYPQYLVLSVLWEMDGQSIGTVAERLGLEPSTVTPLAKRLAIAGLIERRRNQDNERQLLLTLTEAGRAMRARSFCLGERFIAASGMPVEALVRLNGEIRTLRDALAGAQR